MTPLPMISRSRVTHPVRGEDGIALFLVLMIVMVVGVMALAAVAVSGNARLITAYEERQDALESVADAGLELARARINGKPRLYPDSAYAVLENEVEVRDATGALIPGVRRSTYAGPTGVATGQFGVYGSIVSVARAPNGDRVVRRGEVRQESFAKYAYFTDVEPSDIRFGGGDVIQGPVHSNDYIRIYESGATFRGPGGVTTARTIVGRNNATFVEGYTEEVPRIDMPQTAELAKLRGYAQAGGAAFTAPNGGSGSVALIRVEFVAIDLDNSGAADGPNEGFFRVYRMNNNSGNWLMASRPGGNNGWTSSENCGILKNDSTLDTPARRTGNPPWPYYNNSAAYKLAAVRNSASRCYLGGSEQLTEDGKFDANDGRGVWLARPFPLPAGLPARLTGRDDFAHLFPISHDLNPNFKGVIHVNGRVAVSGTVRGKVTLVATDDIFIVDDLKYATAPGSAACADADILGLFGGSDVVVADNTINTPQQVHSSQWYTLDDTKDEYIQAVVLALNTFRVQNFDDSPSQAEACETRPWGRGCLYLTGGIIQRTRGGVGTSGGTGYLKRYAYDVCAYQSPPPYFPTTGHFGRARYYEIDPKGFSPDAFFARWNRG